MNTISKKRRTIAALAATATLTAILTGPAGHTAQAADEQPAPAPSATTEAPLKAGWAWIMPDGTRFGGPAPEGYHEVYSRIPDHDGEARYWAGYMWQVPFAEVLKGLEAGWLTDPQGWGYTYEAGPEIITDKADLQPGELYEIDFIRDGYEIPGGVNTGSNDDIKPVPAPTPEPSTPPVVVTPPTPKPTTPPVVVTPPTPKPTTPPVVVTPPTPKPTTPPVVVTPPAPKPTTPPVTTPEPTTPPVTTPEPTTPPVVVTPPAPQPTTPPVAVTPKPTTPKPKVTVRYIQRDFYRVANKAEARRVHAYALDGLLLRGEDREQWRDSYWHIVKQTLTNGKVTREQIIRHGGNGRGAYQIVQDWQINGRLTEKALRAGANPWGPRGTWAQLYLGTR